MNPLKKLFNLFSNKNKEPVKPQGKMQKASSEAKKVPPSQLSVGPAKKTKNAKVNKK